jgi:hypothetical protein
MKRVICMLSFWDAFFNHIDWLARNIGLNFLVGVYVAFTW